MVVGHIIRSLGFYQKSFISRNLRLWRHLVYWLWPKDIFKNTLRSEGLIEWVVHLVFYVIDFFAIPEIYECIMIAFKWNTRALYKVEVAEARKIFGDAIRYVFVKVDQKAHLGPRQGNFAYVSFNTINVYGNMSLKLLIHELVHVWQYQRFGSVYAYHAMKAQKSTEGYDYGGIESLFADMTKGKRFLDFNFEQQGDILADYYARCHCDETPVTIDETIYKYYAGQLV